MQWIAFPVAVFWLYRLGSLVHEVCHLGQHEMPLFKLTWNLLVGVMTFTPSPFFTRHHRDHHSLRVYGTHEDPEYVANVLKSGSTRSLIGYLMLIIAFPIIVFLRFLLVPLSYLHPKLRKFVLERASYHALHHLFPSLPYHNLKSAHRYLVEVLPSNSPYRELDERNWWGVAKKTLFGV